MYVYTYLLCRTVVPCRIFLFQASALQSNYCQLCSISSHLISFTTFPLFRIEKGLSVSSQSHPSMKKLTSPANLGARTTDFSPFPAKAFPKSKLQNHGSSDNHETPLVIFFFIEAAKLTVELAG